MPTKKPKRMFVLLEVDTTLTAKEVRQAFADTTVLACLPVGLEVCQTHVNVAQGVRTKPDGTKP